LTCCTCSPDCCSSRSVGCSPKPATACEETMDYLIAGVTTILLFVYLIYALLRPERF
jgi:K+-transporting ATPase KdpF subunit